MLVLWLNINSPTQFMVSFIAYNNKGPERFAPSLYISYISTKREAYFSPRHAAMVRRTRSAVVTLRRYSSTSALPISTSGLE